MLHLSLLSFLIVTESSAHLSGSGQSATVVCMCVCMCVHACVWYMCVHALTLCAYMFENVCVGGGGGGGGGGE